MKLSTQIALGLAVLAIPAMALAGDPQMVNPTQQASPPQSPPQQNAPGQGGQFWINNGGAWAQVGAPQGPEAAQAPGGPMRFRINPAGMINAPYVGIEVVPAGEAMDSQLKLPKNTGLLVNYVDPTGPAKSAGIEQNDVLTKFNDQILIDSRQLTVLVRDAKSGESVKFTLIRGGQEQTITVKPEEKETYDVNIEVNGEWPALPPQFGVVPLEGGPFASAQGGAMGGPGGAKDLMVTHDGRSAHLHIDSSGLTMTVTENGQSQEYKAANVADLKKNNPEAYKIYQEFFAQAEAMPVPPAGNGMYIVRVREWQPMVQLPPGAASQETSFSDGTTLILTHESGGHGLHLLAKDKDGKVLFDGPVNTPEQLKSLPPDLRGKFDSLRPAAAIPTTFPAMPEMPIRIEGE